MTGATFAMLDLSTLVITFFLNTWLLVVHPSQQCVTSLQSKLGYWGCIMVRNVLRVVHQSQHYVISGEA